MEKTVTMYSQCKIDKLIPKKGLALFPLKPESLDQWDVTNLDIVKFLQYLLDIDTEWYLFS